MTHPIKPGIPGIRKHPPKKRVVRPVKAESCPDVDLYKDAPPIFVPDPPQTFWQRVLAWLK